jgi:hypothetical protein
MSQQNRGPAKRGSQRWIQILVNEKSRLLESTIARELNLPEDDHIEWLSPLKSEGYTEYFDQASLDKLGVQLNRRPLTGFWPKNGPHWDALGKTVMSQKLLLVEAKSHIRELVSSARASPASLQNIRKSLDETRRFLNSRSVVDWSMGFYQYVNRLAHLYLLRQNDLPAYLIFVYFLNDYDMSGPTTVEEWRAAIDLLHAYLELGRHKLQKYIVDVFIDVSQI